MGQKRVASGEGLSLARPGGEGKVRFLQHLLRALGRAPDLLRATLWSVAHQAPLSMGFPRQEYWSELPFPSPGDFPDPGIKPASSVSPALASRFFTTEPLGKPPVSFLNIAYLPPLQFGERTRDCSPGQAGKEGPHLARTGASQGFPRAAASMGLFSRCTTRFSGSLSCGAREVRSP